MPSQTPRKTHAQDERQTSAPTRGSQARVLNREANSSHPDWQAEYPFADRYFDCGGHQLHYVDEGRGAPVLCVHGNPTWSFYFRRVISEFATTHRVIAVDHIGCGLSDKPRDYPYSLKQHTDNLHDFVRRLDLRDITLVVHDWGGAIGLGVAVREPDRFSRLVLLNTAAFPPPYCPWRIRVCRWPIVRSWGVQRLNLFAKAATVMTTNRAPLSPVARAGLLAPYDHPAHRIAIRRFVEDIPLSQAHPTWESLEQLERALPALASRPTTLIWGMRDWCFTVECLDRLQRLFPRATTTRVDDAGHYVLEDAPEEVLESMAKLLL